MPINPDNPTDNFRNWLDMIENSLRDDCFVKLSIGHYTGKTAELQKIQVRRVIIREQDMLSFTWQGKNRDTVKNTAIDEGLCWIAEAFANDFRTGTLYATDADWTYERAASGRDWLRQAPATHREKPAATHDRQKQHILPAATAAGHWQKALGITGSDGTVLPSAQDKFRQINRYVELLAPLIRDDMLKVADPDTCAHRVRIRAPCCGNANDLGWSLLDSGSPARAVSATQTQRVIAVVIDLAIVIAAPLS